MKRKVITTADGSKTIYLEDWNEHYHSKHGAIQEAYHVFIKNGLRYLNSISKNKTLSILEIGFGTGLNAFITALEADRLKVSIAYDAVEAYPVTKDELKVLNYASLISPKNEALFTKLHDVPWKEAQTITPYFSLSKRKQVFSEIDDTNAFNLVYFDAFGARVQPELWTETIFQLMYNALKNNGVLVTYSAKGSVKRALQTVGFKVERLDGPPGKRHMLRATK